MSIQMKKSSPVDGVVNREHLSIMKATALMPAEIDNIERRIAWKDNYPLGQN